MNNQEIITLEKLVPGGQTIGQLASGKKVFVWGGLPDEKVKVSITKVKSGLAEAVATEVLEPSPHRVQPQDPDSFLSTSPWQIMDDTYESEQKLALVKESFAQTRIAFPQFPHKKGISQATAESELASARSGSPSDLGRRLSRLGWRDDGTREQRPFVAETAGIHYHYRNKMEYSFYGDEAGLHFAFYARGSHRKIPIKSESLSLPTLSELADKILAELQAQNAEARDLKTLIVRANQRGQAAAGLYIKNRDFKPKIAGLPLQIFFSDPKCPASVQTELLSGEPNELQDTILGQDFSYGVDSFFQINLPVYELALQEIGKHISTDKVLDLYSGVGTIGLTVAADKDLTLVEINPSAVKEMQKNAEKLGNPKIKTVAAEAEKALDFITSDETVIVDPPRAGLHKDLVAKLLETRPPVIIYLSCNPATQARDVQFLLEKYQISSQKAFNFFPKTPHIENLIVLKRN